MAHSKGRCHDGRGHVASQNHCKPAAAITYGIDASGKCRGSDGKLATADHCKRR